MNLINPPIESSHIITFSIESHLHNAFLFFKLCSFDSDLLLRIVGYEIISI